MPKKVFVIARRRFAEASALGVSEMTKQSYIRPIFLRMGEKRWARLLD